MNRIYEVLVIDDEFSVHHLLEPIQKMLKRRDLELNISYVNNQTEYNDILKKSFDIILYDNQLTAADFADISKKSQGFELIKAFRKDNRRTKIIFYSSAFDLKNSEFIPFTHEDYFAMINELNIFKIIHKNGSTGLREAIQQAISSLDLIMTTLEKMEDEYNTLNLTYRMDEKDIALKDLVMDLRLDGPISKAFKKDFNEILATYLLNVKIGD